MCGVVGIVAGKRPIQIERLEGAIRTLRHRGPDSQRQWCSDDRSVALASARLSIIDLPGGDQPLASEDGSIHAVVNGEFYGFEAIRSELEADGHRFRTGSDSEILLHLYEDLGFGCIQRLRGEFAFVLWDERRRRLFAARDRFGIKPLFYAERDGGLYVASEIKALAALGLDLSWDGEAYFQQLFVCLPPSRTLFEGVRQVPAGHFLVAEDAAVRIARYWDLDYPRSDEARSELSHDEAVEAVRESLEEAVRVRLRADVPVGCFLSGGLDSSSVLGMAAREATEPIRAFHIAFSVGDYDEREIAEETARKTGAEFRPLLVDYDDFTDHLEDAVWHAEALGINAHGIARFLQSRAVHREGYRVVLSGEGSDEILAGYGHTRQDLARLGAGGEVAGESSAPLAAVGASLGFVPSWLRRIALNRSIFHALLDDDYAVGFADRDPYASFLQDFDVQGQLAGRGPVHQSLYLWARSILPNYILFAERLEMAHSIEVRLPFLDHHLVERVRRVPVSLLVRGTTEKYVLREAAREVLTERVYQRHKHPFTAPPATLTTDNRLYALTRDTLSGPELANVPFFDRGAVTALFDRLPDLDLGTRIALDAALMMILCTVCLQRRYGL